MAVDFRKGRVTDPPMAMVVTRIGGAGLRITGCITLFNLRKVPRSHLLRTDPT